MPLQDLLEFIRRRPFRPFRVYVTDGSAYEVRHPELCMPGARSVVVGLQAPGMPEPVYERAVHIDLIHITRLEPIESAAQAG
ncbi:MAG TPA: hypothetical protein VJ739_09560 [Gemmataceae bacterium]|nr:hypothetical protein [Gemmataceae bacterium]